MSATLAARPRPLHHQQRNSHPPATLLPFPNRKHVDYYVAEKKRESSRLTSVTKPSSPPQISEMRVFAHAVTRIMHQLKGSGLLTKNNPPSVYQWLEAISELKYRRERRDNLGRTVEDGSVIFHAHRP